MADWDAIKAEYIAGGISYRKLAEKHGVSPTTLTKKAIAGKWADKRQQAESKRTARTIEKVAAAGSKVDVRASTIAMQLLQKISNAMDHIDAMDSEAIQRYASAIERLQRVAFEKSVADLEEQKARIAKLQREAEAQQEQSTTITVKLEGDLDEFSG